MTITVGGDVILRNALSQNLSRWHGATNSTTVGGDVRTVNTATVAIDTVATATVNHAAHHRNISGDGASGT